LAVVASAVLAAGPAGAHHAFDMYDQTQEMTLTGVVQQWRFANPHSYLDLVTVPDDQPWSLEAAATGVLQRRGLRADSFAPGDKVTVKLHPARDGLNTGQLTAITLRNGTLIWVQ
jgi:hypothetical protein